MRRFKTVIGTLHGLALAAACTVSMALTTPASAQFARAAGIVDISQPEYLSRDLVIFVQGLDLDEAQRVIVESVYDQYVRDFQSGWDGLQDEITAASELADQQRMDKRELLGIVLEPFQSWRERRQAMGQEFLQNVQLILNDQQLSQWDDFLRRLRREKLMRKGLFSGEDLDLIAVVRDMHLPRALQDQLQAVLDAYALEISDALERRERAFEEQSRDLISMLVDENANEAVRVVKDQVGLRLAVRSTNDRYLEQIAAALPQELGDEFRQQALRKGYPSVYQLTQADRMFESALALDGIDSSTRQAIIAVQGNFEQRISQINEAIFGALREHEPAMEIARAERYAAHLRRESTSTSANATYPLFRDRSGAVQESILQLKDLLTLEQFAQLPGSSRYLKAEINKAQDSIDAAEREREKEAYANEQREYQRAKDLITGSQTAKAAREAAKKGNNDE